MKTLRLVIVSGGLVIIGFVLSWPVTEHATDIPMNPPPRPFRLDLSAFSAASPVQTVDLLFIHHSCGGQLLAAPGADAGENCIYSTHPNGGNLRILLEQSGYRVHEASYGCRIGADTDIFDWLPKFRGQKFRTGHSLQPAAIASWYSNRVSPTASSVGKEARREIRPDRN